MLFISDQASCGGVGCACWFELPSAIIHKSDARAAAQSPSLQCFSWFPGLLPLCLNLGQQDMQVFAQRNSVCLASAPPSCRQQARADSRHEVHDQQGRLTSNPSSGLMARCHHLLKKSSLPRLSMAACSALKKRWCLATMSAMADTSTLNTMMMTGSRAPLAPCSSTNARNKACVKHSVGGR